jgi:hypothetical protein
VLFSRRVVIAGWQLVLSSSNISDLLIPTNRISVSYWHAEEHRSSTEPPSHIEPTLRRLLAPDRAGCVSATTVQRLVEKSAAASHSSSSSSSSALRRKASKPSKARLAEGEGEGTGAPSDDVENVQPEVDIEAGVQAGMEVAKRKKRAKKKRQRQRKGPERPLVEKLQQRAERMGQLVRANQTKSKATTALTSLTCLVPLALASCICIRGCVCVFVVVAAGDGESQGRMACLTTQRLSSGAIFPLSLPLALPWPAAIGR